MSKLLSQYIKENLFLSRNGVRALRSNTVTKAKAYFYTSHDYCTLIGTRSNVIVLFLWGDIYSNSLFTYYLYETCLDMTTSMANLNMDAPPQAPSHHTGILYTP